MSRVLFNHFNVYVFGSSVASRKWSDEWGTWRKKTTGCKSSHSSRPRRLPRPRGSTPPTTTRRRVTTSSGHRRRSSRESKPAVPCGKTATPRHRGQPPNKEMISSFLLSEERRPELLNSFLSLVPSASPWDAELRHCTMQLKSNATPGLALFIDPAEAWASKSGRRQWGPHSQAEGEARFTFKRKRSTRDDLRLSSRGHFSSNDQSWSPSISHSPALLLRSIFVLKKDSAKGKHAESSWGTIVGVRLWLILTLQKRLRTITF